MNTKISRAIVLVILLIIVAILGAYGFRNERELVEHSIMACVQSVCVESTTAGESCVVLNATVSEIVVEADRHGSRLKNIRVIPSTDRCR